MNDVILSMIKLNSSKFFVIIFLFLIFHPKAYSQNYNFHKPISLPLSISAYFGDLRPNHFHMGIDYRVGEGNNLHSIDDGYVARVRVSPYGYGKVVYINHPNGITSVYAHCSQFKGKLDSVVTNAKKNQKNNEIELYLKPNDVPLKKGEIFALSGNTGSSTGPHLHFELRETITDAALNPLLYGLGNIDNFKPTINAIKIYGISKEGFIIPNKSKTYTITNGFLAYGKILELPSNFALMHGRLAFGVSGYDSHSTGACGLYENRISCNNQLIFHSRLDKVGFEETRYINSYKDYSSYKNGSKIHKLFKNKMNQLNTYITNELGGLKVYPCDSIPIEIETIDAYSNSKKLNFSLQIAGGEMDTTKEFFPESMYWIPNRKYQIELKKGMIIIDSLSLYEPLKKSITDNGTSIKIGDLNHAIQSPIIIKLLTTIPSNISIEKYFIGYSDGSKQEYVETTYDKDFLQIKALKFGTYKIICDTTKPNIKIINYTKTNFSGSKKKLIWQISDNESKIKKYDVYINGVWTPANYEYKTKQLDAIYECPSKNVDCIRIEVTDVCGNKQILESEINFR
jgi:hypothetical protein